MYAALMARIAPAHRTAVKVIALAACGATLAATEASAWGPDGHRIVCRIAYRSLDSATQAEIVRLTRLYRLPGGTRFESFEEACFFPDDARARARDETLGWNRFAAFDAWHFMNVPRTTRSVAERHCAGDCVLSAIVRHTEALRTARTDQARAEALLFLAHWVADVHQPLHISFEDDLGGNRVGPIGGGVYRSSNLHAVWDSGILSRAIGRGGWQRYAGRLFTEISPAQRRVWIDSAPLLWAQESYEITTSERMQYCIWQASNGERRCEPIGRAPVLTQAYQDEFREVVDARLQQAGIRLAELIRRHLSVP